MTPDRAPFSELDGTGVNGHHWVFLGVLTDLRFEMTVTDVQTGQARRYQNLCGDQPSWGDTQALAESWNPFDWSVEGSDDSDSTGLQVVVGASLAERTTSAGTGPCVASETTSCLGNGRFEVGVEWQDFSGNQGVGRVRSLTDDSVAFWFFSESSLELMLKVVDGTSINESHWVFAGALSNVGYEVVIRDTQTGVQKVCSNPIGQFGSLSDIGAFPQ